MYCKLDKSVMWHFRLIGTPFDIFVDYFASFVMTCRVPFIPLNGPKFCVLLHGRSYSDRLNEEDTEEEKEKEKSGEKKTKIKINPQNYFEY